MKKVGYISKKKSKGKYYIYLLRSYRKESKVKHEFLYSFGPMPKALERMYWLRDNPNNFPDVLKMQGFELEDLYEWILTLETGVTSTGRKFKL